MRKLLTIASILMLTSSLVISPQAVATEGNDCTCADTEVVWGIQQGADVDPIIYRIDLSDKTATPIADTEKNVGDANYPNGVAYDSAANRLYYAERLPARDSSRLFFYDFAGNQVPAGPLAGGVVAGAEIHDGVYYYIPNNTGDLYAATLLPDGTIGTNIMVKDDVSSQGFTYGFGDMVITADGSTMYLSASTGGVPQFFSIDLSGGSYTSIATGGDMMQLAFGLGGVLYGHSAGDGMFYSVDTATGDTTPIGTVIGTQATVGKFTDLASFQPECILVT